MNIKVKLMSFLLVSKFYHYSMHNIFLKIYHYPIELMTANETTEEEFAEMVKVELAAEDEDRKTKAGEALSKFVTFGEYEYFAGLMKTYKESNPSAEEAKEE